MSLWLSKSHTSEKYRTYEYMLGYTHDLESVCGCDFSVVPVLKLQGFLRSHISQPRIAYTVRCSNILETAAIRCGSVFRCIISSKSCQQRILKNGLQLLPKLWPWVKCLVFIGIQNILRCSTTKIRAYNAKFWRVTVRLSQLHSYSRNIQWSNSKLTSNLAKSVENNSTTCVMYHARRGAWKGTSVQGCPDPLRGD